MIFERARQEAPCLLIFEDLDSLITDNNRSFFLNEVDGLEDNDGLLMASRFRQCWLRLLILDMSADRNDKPFREVGFRTIKPPFSIRSQVVCCV